MVVHTENEIIHIHFKQEKCLNIVETIIHISFSAQPSAQQPSSSSRRGRAMSYETADSQKKEFRRKNGIISQLTRVLVGLYEEPERPANAIDYIKKYLGAPTGVDVEELRADNDELRRQNAELEAKVASLTQQLKELQTEQEEQE